MYILTRNHLIMNSMNYAVVSQTTSLYPKLNGWVISGPHLGGPGGVGWGGWLKWMRGIRKIMPPSLPVEHNYWWTVPLLCKEIFGSGAAATHADEQRCALHAFHRAVLGCKKKRLRKDLPHSKNTGPLRYFLGINIELFGINLCGCFASAGQSKSTCQ